MTTGRINQVTTIHLLLLQSITTVTNSTKPCSQTGVHQTSRRINHSPDQRSSLKIRLAWNEQQLKHLVPRSHKFQAHFSLSHKSNKDHGLQRELLTTGQQKLLTAVIVDSQVVNCNRFSYQQVIHILRSLQAPERYLTLKARKQVVYFPIAWLSYPKSVHSVKTDISMTRIKKSQPSQLHKAYWTRR